jgi:hypothetical protein
MTFVITFKTLKNYSVVVHDYIFIEFQLEDLYMAADANQCGVLTYENTHPFLSFFTTHCSLKAYCAI